MTINRVLILTWLVLLLIPILSAQADPVAKTLRTHNKVIAIRNEASRDIQRGGDITLKDVLQTGKDARAYFRFYDGTLITLGSLTEMTVEKFEAKKDANSAAFEFTKGAFRIVTGLITKTDKPNFSVHTPIGTIGVRGTDFWGGNLSSADNIDIILLDSEHPLTVENAHGKVVITEPGFGTLLTKDQAPTTPKKWSEEKLGRAVQTITFPE